MAFKFLKRFKKASIISFLIPFQIFQATEVFSNSKEYAKPYYLGDKEDTSYLVCDNGQSALMPKMGVSSWWSKADWFVYLEQSFNNDNKIIRNGIRDSIETIKSYIFVPDWAKDTNDFGYVRTLGHLYNTQFYKKDWNLIFDLYTSQDLPSTTERYESVVYKSNNFTQKPYIGKNFDREKEKLMHVFYKKRDGEKLNLTYFFGNEKNNPIVRIKDTKTDDIVGLTTNQQSYKNAANHPDTPMPFTSGARAIFLCPEKGKNILVRSVYPMGMIYEDGSSKYMGLNLIEYTLKTKVRKEFIK